MKRAFVTAILGGLLLVGWGVNACASDKETVVWSRMDFVPFYILSGQFANKGVADKLITFFEQNLPQFNHERQIMTFARLQNDAQKGKLLCNPLLLKTSARQKNYYYSAPVSPIFTHVIVTSNTHERTSEGVSLKKVLDELDGRMIVEDKRSYGKHLDPLLQTAIEQNRIESKNIGGGRALQLLVSGRVDYFMETEIGATYLLRSSPVDLPVNVIPLQEESLQQFGYAVCSKTSAGKKVIDAINQVLSEKQASTEFRQILEFWLNDQNIKRFRDFYEQAILDVN